MTWPTVAINTANADVGTDSPALARSDILDALTKLNQMMAHVSTFAATLLDDPTAAGFKTTLGLINPLGDGQTWQNMSASRTFSVTYTNSTGRSILVEMELGNQNLGYSYNHSGAIAVSGVTVAKMSYYIPASTPLNGIKNSITALVPPGETYVLSGLSGGFVLNELR